MEDKIKLDKTLELYIMLSKALTRVRLKFFLLSSSFEDAEKKIKPDKIHMDYTMNIKALTKSRLQS